MQCNAILADVLASYPAVYLNATLKSLAFQFLHSLIYRNLKHSESQTKTTRHLPYKFICALEPLTLVCVTRRVVNWSSRTAVWNDSEHGACAHVSDQLTP